MTRKSIYQELIVILCTVALLMTFMLIATTPQTKTKIATEQRSFRFLDAELEFNRNFSEYLEQLGFDNYEEVDVSNGLPDLTIVTGFSSNHVDEGRHMIMNASKAFPGRKIIVYGMDLSENEEHWFKNACNVDYRRFNFSIYPTYVRPANYRFKPLIIAMALKEFGAIMWADTSTFWTGKTVSAFLNDLEDLKKGPEEPQAYLLGDTGHNIYVATKSEMYKFLPPYTNFTLQEKLMSQASKMVFIRTVATMEKALKWYVLCALEEGCMEPPGSKVSCNFASLKKGIYAGCHRYDQSAINLILCPYDKSYVSDNMTDSFSTTERGRTENASVVVAC